MDLSSAGSPFDSKYSNSVCLSPSTGTYRQRQSIFLSPGLSCPAQYDQQGRETKLSDSPELISEPSGKEMPASLMTHACE